MTDTKQQVLDHLARCGFAFMAGEPPRELGANYLVDVGDCCPTIIWWSMDDQWWRSNKGPFESPTHYAEHGGIWKPTPPGEWEWMRVPHTSIWPRLSAPPAEMIPERALYEAGHDIFQDLPAAAGDTK
ncbi:MAG: hypothetical protein KAY22_20150 [Rhizorhabdus sp.]|uniref:hypothetical protein n=1 Tax=Rhizorhabdus sp. TaxID=1968843 RepID=UPI001B61CE8D|nr:hypothetical protein [Rhizorhabdus sp.]MBP8234611.1 hypothetical protein [Rhizorhabdus sp.]